MVDRTGRSIDSLSLRDLCDLVQYRLLEKADAKQRKKILGQLANAGRTWERKWSALHPLPGTALASAMGVKLRRLAPPGPDGMAVTRAPVAT